MGRSRRVSIGLIESPDPGSPGSSMVFPRRRPSGSSSCRAIACDRSTVHPDRPSRGEAQRRGRHAFAPPHDEARCRALAGDGRLESVPEGCPLREAESKGLFEGDFADHGDAGMTAEVVFCRLTNQGPATLLQSAASFTRRSTSGPRKKRHLRAIDGPKRCDDIRDRRMRGSR